MTGVKNIQGAGVFDAVSLNKDACPIDFLQVVWIKQADAGLPGLCETETELIRIVQLLQGRFPSIRQVYLSSRTYGGFANTRLNPEPYAYESSFSVKWLIKRQLAGEAALNFDADKGPVKAPCGRWNCTAGGNGIRSSPAPVGPARLFGATACS